jgi:hypothetical protein
MSRNSSRESCPLDCKVYVGELGNNGTRHELEDAFGYYGPLKEVFIIFCFSLFFENYFIRIFWCSGLGRQKSSRICICHVSRPS